MTETIRTGQTLQNREIVLGITGSVAAVDVVKLAHALRRRGASVQGVMTEAARGIIHPDAVTYATGRPTLTRCGGLVEHVTYCGVGGSADVLLIAPCTANTLCKIAAGIDDTPVTTFATTAIGRGMPVVVAPAMHESMYRHPAVLESITRLTSWGITVVDPHIEEHKAKIAPVEEIVLHTERAVMQGPLSGKTVLVTSGRCEEAVDDVRVMTTRSSGRMGREIALQAFRLGADVWVVHRDRFPCVGNVHAVSAADMRNAVHDICAKRNVDYYVSAAALSDFAPERTDGKIPSGCAVSIRLVPQPKLLREVMEQWSPVTVAFKLGWQEGERAAELLAAGVRAVVVNTPDVLGRDEGTFSVRTAAGTTDITGSKEEVAGAVWSSVL